MNIKKCNNHLKQVQMKKILIMISLLVALIFQSCLTSLQPLVTPDKIITDKRIVGNWQGEDRSVKIEEALKSDFYKSQKGSLDEMKKDSINYGRSYLITIGNNGIDHYLLGSLIQLGNSLYMDFTPLTTQNKVHPENDIYNFGAYYAPAFTFAKVEIVNAGSIALKFPDGDFIQDQIKSGNMIIKHEQDNLFGSFLITASSHDLQQFLLKYGHDERIYGNGNSVTLTKKG
jgi:hypothetical protein